MGSFTRQDIFKDDLDVIVSVRSRVLVPEADHVTQFVDDDAELVAVLADRDRLRTVAALSHEWTAPAPQVSNTLLPRTRFFLSPRRKKCKWDLYATAMSFCPSVCLFVCRSKVSNLELRSLLTTNRKSRLTFSDSKPRPVPHSRTCPEPHLWRQVLIVSTRRRYQC